MKKLISILLTAVALLPLLSQAQSDFLFYKLKGVKQKKAVLYSVQGNKTIPVDTARRQSNGAFVFFDIDHYAPGVYTIYFSDSLFTEVIINKETIVMEADKDNIIQTMDVKRSVENQILFDYWRYAIYVKDSINKLNFEKQKVLKKNYGYENEASRLLDDKMNRMEDKLYDFIDRYHQKYPKAFAPKLLLSYQMPSYERYLKDGNEPYENEKDFYFYHFFDNIDFSDERFLHTKVLFVTVSDFMQNFASPASTANYNKVIDIIMPRAAANEKVRLYFLNLFIDNFDNTIWEDVFVHLVDRYLANHYYPDPQTAAYYIHKSNVIKSLKPGKKAPPLILPDTSGQMVDVMKIKAKAKMLVFYSSDCPHCEEAMPGLKEVYQAYHDKGLEVIGIAIDDDATLWKNHIVKDSLTWVNVSDLKGMASPVITNWNIWMTPTIIILDKRNVIMKKPRGEAEIHSALLQLLY